ncbi:MAG TPA: glycolate oxidase subunit GlcE [Stellaceae bacterium]|jgi:glycolate oxidase FAD binding subunit|nr:glycolate oxidase subunit GlcE [Stellaceae bacterium]
MTVFRPKDEQELAGVIQQALEREEPLELLGGGSKRGLGRPPQTPHRLELGAFSGIRVYEPEELVLTAGAATPLAEIEAALDGANQMLAFEPGDWRGLLGTEDAAPTIGGVLACNLSGPRRIRQGAARDHFLGLTGVSGRGEAFKAGGRVVKNVTGYDLCKLMAGSYGTLAALTEVTVKVLPRPEATRTLVLRGLDDGAALAAMTETLNSAHEPSGAAHLPQGVAVGDKAATVLRVEGPVPSVEARIAALARELQRFGTAEILDDADSHGLWRSLRDVAPLAAPGDRARTIWRVSVAPSAAPGFLAAIRKTLDARSVLDWGGGLVWLAIAGAEDGGAAAIRAALRSGHATLIRAPDALRASVPVFQPRPPAVEALTERLKDSFDPKRILNRGRMYRSF